MRIAASFGATESAPTTSQGYSMALAGALAGMVDGDGDVDAALRFLSLPVGAPLQQRPLLMLGAERRHLLRRQADLAG